MPDNRSSDIIPIGMVKHMFFKKRMNITRFNTLSQTVNNKYLMYLPDILLPHYRNMFRIFWIAVLIISRSYIISLYTDDNRNA